MVFRQSEARELAQALRDGARWLESLAAQGRASEQVTRPPAGAYTEIRILRDAIKDYRELAFRPRSDWHGLPAGSQAMQLHMAALAVEVASNRARLWGDALAGRVFRHAAEEE